MKDSGALLFTDLDGSLLDHYDYNYRAAVPSLKMLEAQSVPVIPASSKTRAEIENLRRELDNTHPFIAENGAATFIPEGYFPHQPAGTKKRDGYWVREMSEPRSHWLHILAGLEDQFKGDFDYFFRTGTAGIARITGLGELEAAMANQREYSEPVQWLGTSENKRKFVQSLEMAGASVLQGGRFLAVSGDCDKGRALAWLRSVYRDQSMNEYDHDLAVGDSDNDVAMLLAAKTALLIRSPVHDFPDLGQKKSTIYSRACGPQGWAEGVALWLQQCNFNGMD